MKNLKEKNQRTCKTIFTNLKIYSRDNFKSFYPIMFSYAFLFLLLFSMIAFFSFSQLDDLDKYEDFLINDLKPTFQATGEVDSAQLELFGLFVAELQGALISMGLILFIGLLFYAALKSTKDLILWNQIHKKKLFSKKTFTKNLFLKFSLVNFISSLVLWTLSVVLLFFVGKPLLVLSLIFLLIFGFDFVNLFFQAKFQKKFVDIRGSLRLFGFTITSFLLILISWWILSLLISAIFFWNMVLFTIFILLLLIFLFSKRELLLFLFANYIFQKRSKK